jgi:hypothetical protein
MNHHLCVAKISIINVSSYIEDMQFEVSSSTLLFGKSHVLVQRVSLEITYIEEDIGILSNTTSL